ncbi:hypothetical protein IscW_ISCW009428, partial [Ixodes scapularis]
RHPPTHRGISTTHAHTSSFRNRSVGFNAQTVLPQESPSTTSPPPLPRTPEASHGHVRASREYHPRLEQVATGSGTTHGWLRRHDAAISRSAMTSGRLRVCVTRYTSRSRSSSDT